MSDDECKEQEQESTETEVVSDSEDCRRTLSNAIYGGMSNIIG